MATEIHEDDCSLNIDCEPAEEYRNLVKKPNSIIWNHFGLVADNQNVPGEIEKPVCRSCNTTVSAKRANTTNLFRHIQDHHPDIYATMDPVTTTRRSRLNPRHK